MTPCAALSVLPDQAPSRPPLSTPADPLSPRVQALLAAQNPGVAMKVWVFFTDKGLPSEATYQEALRDYEGRLPVRALERRRLRKAGNLVDVYDLPVHDPYVQGVIAAGGRVHSRSRWLNGVSASVTPEAIRVLARLPFVRSIEPVTVYRRPLPPAPVPDIQTKPAAPSDEYALDYGSSFTQLAQIRVPQLHALGLSGRGVLVAMFDTGFNLNHTAFDSLRTRVVAEKDFIHGDGNTADDPQQGDVSGQHDHGTETLSTVAGYAPGSLIGPAYGASFLLAKTESVAFEQQVEEDWWMQAVEWADSMGVDVISSSLGYNAWYTYEDMDGETAVTTQAANIAVSRGIVVVNAMGNEGQSLWQKMIAPADAPGAVSVGAVDSTGTLAAFSSKGPTFDGRIKPDVVAMGVAVRVVNPNSADQYFRLNGTSFATPLVAGVAALLLEAYPHWTPAQVLAALRSNASRAAVPDTLMGHGIVHALNALLTEARSQVASFTAISDVEGVLLEWETTTEINIRGWQLLRNTSPDGPLLLLTPEPLPGRGSGAFGTPRSYFFVDTTAVPGGTYEYRLAPVSVNGLPLETQPLTAQVTFTPSDTTNLPPFALHQNVPNPFNPETAIAFDMRRSAHVRLTIYNAIGQEVRVLVDELRPAGQYTEVWDGTAASGRPLASGVYFYRLAAGPFFDAKKMILIR
jgi:subtilisin family serine protease